jgi:hypothetical protein
MKRGQVFVKAFDENGVWGTVDALDLDEVSWRAFVMDRLQRAGLVFGMKEDLCEGQTVTYRARRVDDEGRTTGG